MQHAYLNPAEVKTPGGRYSHGVVSDATARVLHTAGQVAARPDGTIAQGVDAQFDQIYQNIDNILRAGGMSLSDIVKVTVYMTDRDQLIPNRKAMERWLGETRPASTAVVVAALASPDFLVEVDAVAMR